MEEKKIWNDCMEGLLYYTPDEVVFDKKKTCCFSGHRKFNIRNISLRTIGNKLLDLVDNHGYDTFLIGGAIGFDTFAFIILEKLRLSRNIKIILCAPCRNQEKPWNKKQKQEYRYMCENVDKIVLIKEYYDEECMHERNDYMVENSSEIIVYLRHNFGGTYYTLDKAERERINIFKV